jgi:hypothetical protein
MALCSGRRRLIAVGARRASGVTGSGASREKCRQRRGRGGNFGGNYQNIIGRKPAFIRLSGRNSSDAAPPSPPGQELPPGQEFLAPFRCGLPRLEGAEVCPEKRRPTGIREADTGHSRPVVRLAQLPLRQDANILGALCSFRLLSSSDPGEGFRDARTYCRGVFEVAGEAGDVSLWQGLFHLSFLITRLDADRLNGMRGSFNTTGGLAGFLTRRPILPTSRLS